MPSLTLETHSAEQTQQLGRVLAPLLEPGDVIELVGDLGAGKTHFVQGIVAGLGVSSEVANSPTFVLIQEYTGRLSVCHVDAYRLRDSDEFVELGADELLGSEAVCLIEWGDRVADVLPRDRLRVKIQVTGELSRSFALTASGRRSEELLRGIGKP